MGRKSPRCRLGTIVQRNDLNKTKNFLKKVKGFLWPLLKVTTNDHKSLNNCINTSFKLAFSSISAGLRLHIIHKCHHFKQLHSLCYRFNLTNQFHLPNMFKLDDMTFFHISIKKSICFNQLRLRNILKLDNIILVFVLKKNINEKSINRFWILNFVKIYRFGQK